MSVGKLFISYNRADKQWAEWIAWTLEEAGHTVSIQLPLLSLGRKLNISETL